jgi:DNA-binding HxlR family transcriptional regulator
MTRRAHTPSLCPRYHRAIELIGRRWSGAILQVMRGGVVRFSDMAAAIPGLSDRMLSERLKELESESLIERRVFPETPVRVEYRLTAGGEALGEVLDAVKLWAHTWIGEADGTGTTGSRTPSPASPARPSRPPRAHGPA